MWAALRSRGALRTGRTPARRASPGYESGSRAAGTSRRRERGRRCLRRRAVSSPRTPRQRARDRRRNGSRRILLHHPRLDVVRPDGVPEQVGAQVRAEAFDERLGGAVDVTAGDPNAPATEPRFTICPRAGDHPGKGGARDVREAGDVTSRSSRPSLDERVLRLRQTHRDARPVDEHVNVREGARQLVERAPASAASRTSRGRVWQASPSWRAIASSFSPAPRDDDARAVSRRRCARRPRRFRRSHP